MGKSVRFTKSLESPSTIKMGPTKSILRKTTPLEPVTAGHAVTNIYNGNTKVQAQNLFSVYRELVKVLESGSYGQNARDTDTPVSQDIEYPTCLEAYSVLNTIIRIQIDEQPTQTPPAHPNQLLLWAKRDLLAYKNSQDILNSRVTIQILRAVDFLFYADGTRQSINPSTAKFFLEEALDGITGASSSKALLGICLHIFNHIHLPNLLDKSLVLRLLRVISSKAQNTRSSALIGEFVVTCKTMFRHHKQIMVQNSELWIPMVMDTVFDQSSYIRLQGTQFFMELARLKLAPVSVAVYDYLNVQIDEQGTNLDLAVKRMLNLIETSGEVKQTFTIWSTILLFMGSNPQIKLETWPQLAEWLEVARHGFTSTSLTIKEYTYTAWKTVLYLFLFRYDNNLSISRNIVSLINPIKPKRHTSLVIFEKFCSCFDASLFMALRTCENTTKHWDTTFEHLISPCIKAMLEHPNAQVKKVGFQYMTSLFSLPTGSKASRARILDEKQITAQEIGGLPKQWIKGNVGRLVGLLSCAVENSMEFENCSKLWTSLVGITRQASSSDDDTVYSHLLACVNFLKSSAQYFTQSENKQLFSNFVCSFNYNMLVATRYKVDPVTDKVEVARDGQTSCAILMISNTTHLEDEAFDEILAKFTSVHSRQVAIMAKIMLSNANNKLICQNSLNHMIRLLSKPNFGYFEEEDVRQTIAVLDTWSSKSLCDEWCTLFTCAFNKADYPALFIDFIKHFCEFDDYFDRIFDFKKSIFVDVSEFDEILLNTALAKAPKKLEPSSLTEFPSAFKNYVGRYFFATFEADSMDVAIDIIGECAIKMCADIVLNGIAEGNPRALEIWNSLYVQQTPAGEYTPAIKARARDLQQEGKLTLPSEIPPRAASAATKRALAVNSETQSTEPHTPTKRLRGSDSYIPSPPVSSDLGELYSSPPSLRKNSDMKVLSKLLHPVTFHAGIKGMRRHELLEMKARLEQSLEILNEHAPTSSID